MKPALGRVGLPRHVERPAQLLGGDAAVEVRVQEVGDRGDVGVADRGDPDDAGHGHRHLFTSSFARRQTSARFDASPAAIRSTSAGRALADDRVSRLQPVVLAGRPGVAGVRPAVAVPPQAAKNAAVVGTERAGGLGDRASHNPLEHRPRVHQLLAQGAVVEASPGAMAHAVATDAHAGAGELPDAGLVEEPGRAQPPGDDEEGRGQTPPAQARERVLDVRGVPVVEGQPDVVATGDRVEHRLEPVGVRARPDPRPDPAVFAASRCREN